MSVRREHFSTMDVAEYDNIVVWRKPWIDHHERAIAARRAAEDAEAALAGFTPEHDPDPVRFQRRASDVKAKRRAALDAALFMVVDVEKSLEREFNAAHGLTPDLIRSIEDERTMIRKMRAERTTASLKRNTRS